MADANLLITFDPTHAGMAQEEAKAILKEVGEEAEFLESKIDGLFKVKVSDAKAVVKKVREECENNPAKFEKTFHWIPIEKWCKSEIKDMQDTIKSFVDGIKQEEKWKMDLGKRQWDKMPTPELIVKLTDPVDRPNVDLKNPEKIIEVQIIGDEAGIALLNKDELVDVPSIKGKK